REISRQWKRAGITHELITDSAQAAGPWDIAYRKLRMEEPFIELSPFLAAESTARLERLSHLPDWLRRELLELDTITDWRAVTERMQAIHEHLYQQLEYI